MSAVVSHLDRQVRSTQRLLQIVLAQTDSIKDQDTEAVLAQLGEVQAELGNRAQLEQERDSLIRDTAMQLGVDPDEVTLETMLSSTDPVIATRARELSAELRGLLGEIERVHGQNRVLIRQELSFLGHLMRVLSGTPQGSYSPFGETDMPQATNAVDARA
ncbi:MAG: flagellar protein FlgN [Gaiellaceae bacterium]